MKLPAKAYGMAMASKLAPMIGASMAGDTR
jgi:hypothetical protein